MKLLQCALFPYTTLFRSLGEDPHVGVLVPVMGHLAQRGRDLLVGGHVRAARGERKSTRLDSSHPSISYAVFCLKKKAECTFTTNNAPRHYSVCCICHSHL